MKKILKFILNLFRRRVDDYPIKYTNYKIPEKDKK